MVLVKKAQMQMVNILITIIIIALIFAILFVGFGAEAKVKEVKVEKYIDEIQENNILIALMNMNVGGSGGRITVPQAIIDDEIPRINRPVQIQLEEIYGEKVKFILYKNGDEIIQSLEEPEKSRSYTTYLPSKDGGLIEVKFEIS